MNFVIDRSKWICGGGEDNGVGIGKGKTLMLNPEGFMCCLGHVYSQCGVPKEKLLNKEMPGIVASSYTRPETNKNLSVLVNVRPVGDIMAFFNNELSSDAVEINDDPKLTMFEREARLKELFDRHGHKLTFKGQAETND